MEKIVVFLLLLFFASLFYAMYLTNNFNKMYGKNFNKMYGKDCDCKECDCDCKECDCKDRLKKYHRGGSIPYMDDNLYGEALEVDGMNSPASY